MKERNRKMKDNLKNLTYEEKEGILNGTLKEGDK